MKIDDQTLAQLVLHGDLSRLSPAQKLDYYKARCDAAGLDPRTQPFQVISLPARGGHRKEILYALKSATDQLSSKHLIRTEILEQETIEGIRVVTVRASSPDGRQTEDVGCVPISGLRGDDLANALMKCVTKAKRRAVLSLCGLGLLDETELDTIRDAREEDSPELEGLRSQVVSESRDVSADDKRAIWKELEFQGRRMEDLSREELGSLLAAVRKRKGFSIDSIRTKRREEAQAAVKKVMDELEEAHVPYQDLLPADFNLEELDVRALESTRLTLVDRFQEATSAF